MTLHHCPPRTPAESHPEYAARVLRYALLDGPEPLTLEQLELADAQALVHVAALPARLDADAARLDQILHALRLRLAAQMVLRRAQAAQETRTLAALSHDTIDAYAAPGGASGPDPLLQTDQDRALRLLRAALTLILTPPDGGNGNGGGGRPAPLIPPAPTRPPAGAYADRAPNLPPKDGINF